MEITELLSILKNRLVQRQLQTQKLAGHPAAISYSAQRELETVIGIIEADISAVHYRGYAIQSKRDFGSNGFLIHGKMVKSGYIVVKDGVLAIPGACWTQTIAAAKIYIDLLIQSETEKSDFWELERALMPLAKYNLSDFPKSSIATRSYRFRCQDKRDTAAHLLNRAFGLDLEKRVYRIGWDSAWYHYLTVFIQVPSELDALIQKRVMGMSDVSHDIYIEDDSLGARNGGMTEEEMQEYRLDQMDEAAKAGQ